MRRGKPQQQYYKPGSFKSRPSNHGSDDTASESGSTRNFRGDFVPTDESRGRAEVNSNFEVNRDQPRRIKKPERELYVPRAVAQAREQLSPQNSQNYAQDSGIFKVTY